VLDIQGETTNQRVLQRGKFLWPNLTCVSDIFLKY